MASRTRKRVGPPASGIAGEQQAREMSSGPAYAEHTGQQARPMAAHRTRPAWSPGFDGIEGR